jgi:hypothetical protein
MLKTCICLLSLSIIAGSGAVTVQAQSSNDSESLVKQDPLSVALTYSAMRGKEVAHPDFILPSIDDPNENIQLSNYRGKKVLLLHFASW